MTDNSKSPLYSLVTYGRNDNYNPDFLYRLQTMLNFNARALEKIERLGDVEFVVVDWGSAVPLREALALEVPAASATSFLELSPEIAARVSHGPNTMHNTRAQNVGIRRAQGRFVGVQGADLLTTSASWRALLSALDDRHDDFPALSRSVLLIPRRTVPWSFVARQPDLDRWERWLLTCSQVTPVPPRSSFPATGGGMGIIILHRDLWRDASALEETFSGWGYNDIDLVSRVSAHHPWIDAGAYGVACHKMEHAPHGVRGRILKGGGNSIAINRPWITTSLASRVAEWGLPQLALETKRAEPDAKHAKVSPATLAHDHWSESTNESAERYFDSDISDHVRATLGRAKYDEAELETLHMLSWFGMRKFPFSYLEIGLRHQSRVRAISTACPSVDIYILESEEKDRDGAMHRAVDICANLLWEWGHKGYFRASAGNLLTNFENLRQSFIGPFEFEAVTLQLDKSDDVKLLPLVLKAVVHGGLFAIHAAKAELLDAGLEICGSVAPEAHVMRGHSRRTAFLFVERKELRVAERKSSTNGHPSFLRMPMRTRMGFRVVGIRRRVRRKLSRVGKIFR